MWFEHLQQLALPAVLVAVIGYLLGSSFQSVIESVDHWFSFALLAGLGINMIRESRSEEEKGENKLTVKVLLLQAVATSIDALSIGVLFIPVPEVLWTAIALIALVSTAFSVIGYLLGKTLGHHLPFNANILGGCILIAIGIKIFVEGFFH